MYSSVWQVIEIGHQELLLEAIELLASVVSVHV